MNAPVPHPQSQMHSAHEPSSALARVLARMPAKERDGFSAEQLAALDAALDNNNPGNHPVNLRVTLFGRAYVVVLAGREGRKPRRRAEERERHPLSSPGNIAFLIGVAIAGLALGNSLHWLLFGG